MQLDLLTVSLHLEYASKLGLDLVHFSEPRVLGSLEDGHLKQVKRRADGLGLAIEVGMGSICPTFNRFSRQQGKAVEQLQRMLHVAEEYQAALAVQQRLDLERSVRYCRETLGIGEHR